MNEKLTFGETYRYPNASRVLLMAIMSPTLLFIRARFAKTRTYSQANLLNVSARPPSVSA